MLFPDEEAARLAGGDAYYCPSTLPTAGETVDVRTKGGTQTRTAKVVTSKPALQKSLYGQKARKVSSAAVPGFESIGCGTVTVQYDDGTTETIAAAQAAPVAGDDDEFTVFDGALLAAYGGIMLWTEGPRSDTRWADAKDAYNEQLKALKGMPHVYAPPSGDYWGSSDESDDGDQAVRVRLDFKRDGTITGRGRDGVDGSYKITGGRWAEDEKDEDTVRVEWMESYDEGFTVVCSGTFKRSTGKVTAKFTSSRSISGRFELAMKPSVFG